MKERKFKTRRGFALIDIMAAAVILIIALIGTSAYQYNASLQIRKSNMHANGIRIAALLCEGWSGRDGDTSFDPNATLSPDLNITADTGPSVPTGFTLLGSYKIIVDGSYFFTTLSWQDIDDDVRALNVTVNWDHCDRGTNTLADACKSYQLTAYVKNQS